LDTSKLQKIILFDQDLQPYRYLIYKRFKNEFKRYGFSLLVYFDKQNNNKYFEEDYITGIDYSFKNFKKVIRKNKCSLIVQFVWLRYKFLLPFMIWARFRRVKIILWSHGINLQKKNQPLFNLFYYLRQNLADALILYSPEQVKYIKTSKNKIFIANNTLNLDELPVINKSQNELKNQYGYRNKKVLLFVGRLDVNNRSIEDFLGLSDVLDDGYVIIIIGPGMESNAAKNITSQNSRIKYLGPFYDNQKVSEYYKMSDIFVMPGAIGLSIVQAFYYETPVLVQDVPHGPEAFYLVEGENGYYYHKGDINDMKQKLRQMLKPAHYEELVNNCRRTVSTSAAFGNMLKGFEQAINYAS